MRLDVFLTEKKLVKSRTQAKELIISGAVSVNGAADTKPSSEVEDGAVIVIDESEKCRYVSRGGLKLERAIEYFGIDPGGRICIDIGASTGGFTDCLLKYGAKKIYAVDSGTNQLDVSLRKNPKVVSAENTNARYITEKDIGEKCSLAVMDVSFISQTKLYTAVSSVLVEGGELITLIKPQFETGRSAVGKGGIVTDAKARNAVIENIKTAAAGYGFLCRGVIESPIKGGDGNTEYLACFDFRS